MLTDSRRERAREREELRCAIYCLGRKRERLGENFANSLDNWLNPWLFLTSEVSNCDLKKMLIEKTN